MTPLELAVLDCLGNFPDGEAQAWQVAVLLGESGWYRPTAATVAASLRSLEREGKVARATRSNRRVWRVGPDAPSVLSSFDRDVLQAMSGDWETSCTIARRHGDATGVRLDSRSVGVALGRMERLGVVERHPEGVKPTLWRPAQ